MWKLIKILLAGMVFSMFYFPFEFTFLPGYNTKKILAVVGALFVVYNCIKSHRIKIPRDVVSIVIFASIVSVIGLISVVYNGTPDYVYATYIISMLVWLSAAYASVSIIKIVHGKINIRLLCNYIITICVVQCVLAQMIDSMPSFKNYIDTYIEQGQIFLNEVDRLYGIGANLDVAGSRFAAALILIVCILSTQDTYETTREALYILSFIVIAVLGSMIARTTYVGGIVAGVFLILNGKLWNFIITKRNLKIFVLILLLLSVSIPVFVHLYNTDPQVHKMIRFAFEGFFNLAETGEWSIASNERLKTMYVFPDNLKTWIIGDGYFNNPVNVDPYYVGEITGGYYKGTDVGYLRFIFYFGLIGLSAFMLFFIKVTQYCVRGFPKYQWMFILLLIANFVIWLKVSTDIFLVFALFLSASNMQDEDPQLSLEPNPELEL